MAEGHKQCAVTADGSVDLGKLWEPRSNYTYVCGRHFISGEKSNVEIDPDYVPSIFPAQSNPCFGAKRAPSNRFPRKQLKVDQSLMGQEEFLNHNGTSVYVDSQNPGDMGNEDSFLHVGPMEVFSFTYARTADHTYHVSPMLEPPSASDKEAWDWDMDRLRRERDKALAKMETLEKLVQAKTLSSTAVEGNDQKCLLMTGLKWNVFLQLFTFIRSFIGGKGLRKGRVPLREQLFLTLVKLRHRASFEFLALITGIPRATCANLFWKWIELLHVKAGFLVKWPDRENMLQIPDVFREKFPRLTCVVDCLEIIIDAPKQLFTIKVFVGCDPSGMVTYLSPARGGRASDLQIVRNSGFIDRKYHRPGDQILAHEGLTLSEDFASKCSCELVTPASEGKDPVRAHMERVTGLMTSRFNILKGPLPVRSVGRDETVGNTLTSCDKIITVCAALTNMGEGIVY